jgi:enamine deaminase RidA (YjgF/YER057c/UK114 family)
MNVAELVGKGDAGAQTRFIFTKIEQAIIELGGTRENIVRTRMYVVRREDVAAVTKAHAEFFGTVRPAATLLLVAGFIDPNLLVEIEAEAIL